MNEFELCKGFSMEKMVQICQILRGKKKPKLPYFYDKFQTVADNIEGFLFF
jgi:hypothetical protein